MIETPTRAIEANTYEACRCRKIRRSVLEAAYRRSCLPLERQIGKSRFSCSFVASRHGPITIDFVGIVSVNKSLSAANTVCALIDESD
jgi:hypothetical protein